MSLVQIRQTVSNVMWLWIIISAGTTKYLNIALFSCLPGSIMNCRQCHLSNWFVSVFSILLEDLLKIYPSCLCKILVLKKKSYPSCLYTFWIYSYLLKSLHNTNWCRYISLMNVWTANSTRTHLCASLWCIYNFGECVCLSFQLNLMTKLYTLFQEECGSIIQGMTILPFTFQANWTWIWKTISLNVKLLWLDVKQSTLTIFYYLCQSNTATLTLHLDNHL